MDENQVQRMKQEQGFIAALDQSGGSTPKALEGYGISKDQYKNEEEMFDLVHQMRTRIITSPVFTSAYILAAILFERTMESKIEGLYTADYLWEKKGIIPFLKVDQGMEEEAEGVQLMKPIKNLDSMLDRASERNIFGTKMRSVIKSANSEGIKKIVDQQFEVGRQIIAKRLVPILEPEVDIHSPDKAESEKIMREEILRHLDQLSEEEFVIFKLSIPSEEGFYSELVKHPQVIRVVALSGGYSRDEAVEKLEKNPGVIASFSRALLEGVSANQGDEEFNRTLEESINKIYKASIT